jgi:hypothetical protein
MTANELADKCNRLQGEIILGFLADCATMLRQQQAEIEELRKFISLDENRRTEWYAYELGNEMKRYKKASEK